MTIDNSIDRGENIFLFWTNQMTIDNSIDRGDNIFGFWTIQHWIF